VETVPKRRFEIGDRVVYLPKDRWEKAKKGGEHLDAEALRYVVLYLWDDDNKSWVYILADKSKTYRQPVFERELVPVQEKETSLAG